MAHARHSYVPFYPSDWMGGTARMGSLQRLVYFEICLFNWDRVAPCPPTELPLIFHDLPDWQAILDTLVKAKKLILDDRGYWNPRAIDVAEKAFELWRKKSKGGSAGAAKTNAGKSADDTPDGSPDGTPDASLNAVSGKGVGTPAAEPEPEPEPDKSDGGGTRALAKSGGEKTDLHALAALAARTGGVRRISGANQGEYVQLVKDWVALGSDEPEIVATIAGVVETHDEPINHLRFFDGPIRRAIARRENQANGTGTRTTDHPRPRTGSRAEEMDYAHRRLCAGE